MAIANIQAKHKGKMSSLRKMIKKSLLLRKFLFATLPPNSNTSSKLFPLVELLFKLIEW